MTIKKFSTLLVILVISIPLIMYGILLIDIQINIPDAKFSPRHRIYILILLILSILLALLFLLFFYKLYDFFKQIQKTTANLSCGNLKESVFKNIGPNTKLTETTTILQNLESMRISLIEAQNQTNRFLIGISHDIRTPISIIKGYTEALSDGIFTTVEEKKNALDVISSKTQQLEGITESLIDFMRMDVKDLRDSFDRLNLYSQLNYFSKSCMLTLSLYDRNFSYHLDIPNDIYIKANRNLMLRALDNLFSNAIRYTKNGDSIELYAKKINNDIKISIKDSGIGIEDKDLNYIFNLFYRGNNSSHENGGLGIGLAVVHNISEIHGWKVSCKSKENEGSIFTITIPEERCSNI